MVLKVVSPDALHKSEAGGVVVGLHDEQAVIRAFDTIENRLKEYRIDSRFQGVRVVKMASDGVDMFIGGKRDRSFGPVVLFGYGGVYVEVFKDIQILLCPETRMQVLKKVQALRSYRILKGTRGRQTADIDAYVDAVVRVCHLLARFPEIRELDLNPVRVFSGASGALVLDARARISGPEGATKPSV